MHIRMHITTTQYKRNSSNGQTLNLVFLNPYLVSQGVTVACLSKLQSHEFLNSF